MPRSLALLALVLMSLSIAGCGGGGGGSEAAQPANGMIQVLNNEPTFISAINLGVAGSGAPKVDQLNGALLPGAGFTFAVAPGNYELEVFVSPPPGSAFAPIRRYTVSVGPGELQTIVVAP